MANVPGNGSECVRDPERCVLIYAPLGRDGALIRSAMTEADIDAILCPDLPALYERMEAGAACVLLTIDAFRSMSVERFVSVLGDQPAWSDLPVLLLAGPELPADAEAAIYSLGNITVLERPVRLPALLAAIRAAVRARDRQYQVRELLESSAMQQTHIEALNERLQRSMTETHHRVKNNLQVIAAMIDIQVLDGAEMLPAHEFVRLSQQVRTLAVVHDLLTEQAKVDGQAHTVSAKAVLEKLLPLLASTISQGRKINVEIEDARLSARQGTSLALVACELVSNAAKHGRGSVAVAFRTTPTGAELEVCDDGDGFPTDFDPVEAANTGLMLIENLSRWDLNGAARYENRPGGGAVVTATIGLDRALA